MPGRKLPAFLLLLFCIMSLGIPPTASEASKEKKTVLSNNNYLVIAEKNKLSVLDMNSGKIIEKEFENPLGSLDICPSCPFIYFEEEISGVRVENGEEFHFNQEIEYVLDMETGTLYRDRSLDDYGYGVKWSPDGAYALMMDPFNIAVVKTAGLREYFNMPFEEQVITDEMLIAVIQGHPAGDIVARHWVGSTLLYESGVNFIYCYGAYEVAKRKNYLLGCCGLKEFTDVTGCGDFGELQEDQLIDLYFQTTRSGRKTEISNKFYDELSRIIKERQEAAGTKAEEE